jgi:hypothetical protein
MRTRLVTEGRLDAEILRPILGLPNRTIDEISFRSGLVSAVSAVTTILSTKNDRVILVIDSDSEENTTNVDYVRELVGKDSERFKLIRMVPEIESLFFVDKHALEKALKGEISNIVWKIGLSSPKNTLTTLLSEKRKRLEDLLVNPDLIKAMRNHPKIKEIEAFAQAAHA